MSDKLYLSPHDAYVLKIALRSYLQQIKEISTKPIHTATKARELRFEAAMNEVEVLINRIDLLSEDIKSEKQ